VKIMDTAEEQIIAQHEQVAPQLWLSSDTGKASFVASWRLAGGPPVQPADIRKMQVRQFERTRQGVREWIEWGESHLPQGGQLCVIMESTGPYSLEMAAWSAEFRPSARVVHMRAKQMKEYIAGIGLRNKTDKLDARAIAAYGAERMPEAHEPVGEEHQSLRALTRMRQSLLEQVTQVSNQHDTITSEHLGAAVRKQLGKVHKKILDALDKQIQQIDTMITDLIESHEGLKKQAELLQTIEGVGWRTAAIILGELGDLKRFRTCRQLTAFAGLNPVLRQSADKQWKSRISKHGSRQARRALYMSAMSAIRHNNMLCKRYGELLARGKTSMTALIAIMRQLLVLMRGILKSGKPYDTNYAGCGQAVKPL
jgi:transposase